MRKGGLVAKMEISGKREMRTKGKMWISGKR
jgi:hypothetical protein